MAEFERRLAERGADVDVRDGHEECLIHLLAPQRVEQNAFDQAQSLVALKGLADEQKARLHSYTSWCERLLTRDSQGVTVKVCTSTIDFLRCVLGVTDSCQSRQVLVSSPYCQSSRMHAWAAGMALP